MNKEEIQKKITEILRPFVRESSSLDTMTGDTKLIEDLKVNSARLVDIVLSIEEEFDIEMPDEELDKLKTIGNFVGFIEGKL